MRTIGNEVSEGRLGRWPGRSRLMKANAPILAAEISARETWVMTAWVGLAGVIAGAIIAFAGQYVMRRGDKQERFDALLLEQFADIIALSEDFRNRIWEERNQVASDVVSKWDLGRTDMRKLVSGSCPKSQTSKPRLKPSIRREQTLATRGGQSPAIRQPSTAR
jgi:hypothetical protein